MKNNEKLTFSMRRLNDELSKGSFHGFTLQKGFWYGYNFRGQPVATSGWIKDDALIMYTQKEDGKWYKRAYPSEVYKRLLPQVMVESLRLS